MTLTSPAFVDDENIPSDYTCEGAEANPPLSIAGVPHGTKTLALIMEDRDVPKALLPSGVYDHWVLFNIPSSTIQIGKGESVGTAGSNASGKEGYVGPCPPPQYEPQEHRYTFTLYALDEALPLNPGASKEALEIAMQGHVLDEARLVGRYKRRDASK